MHPTRKLMENLLLRRVLGLCWHLAGIVLCYVGAYLLRFDFDLDLEWKHHDLLVETMPLVIVVFSLMVYLFGLHQGLWRFFTFRDCIVTAAAFATGTVIFMAALFVWKGFDPEFGGFARSIWVINYFLILAWEVGGRGVVRLYREFLINRTGGKRGDEAVSLLVGDFEECNALLRAVQQTRESLGRVVGILVDRKVTSGTRLQGIRVYSGLDQIGEIVAARGVDNVVILPPYQAPNSIRSIVDTVSARKVSPTYRVIPSMDDLATGRISASQIRRVEIEDLLEREPYEVDVESLREFVADKRVLVTGAGGSIGSEICRQVLSLGPRSLVLFEMSEFLLFEVERELRPVSEEAGVELIACTGDVRRDEHLSRAIAKSGGIDIVYHAAAYKHVDLMERNPGACFFNNVIGTAVVARVAEECGAEDFVLVSTDKAVRPTSLMGASKRLAERVLMERPDSATRFKAVRFGNVLGSSGSVVPIFREQIEKGGPVTVTSREVCRFFMTIPEAVELVLAAGSQEEDRRVYVLEMGQPVKIDSLARRMIELSGFVPGVDIEVRYTGLKPGEKEREELLTDDENVERTALDRIWVVSRDDSRRDVDRVDIGRLLELIDGDDRRALREYVHGLIPGSQLLGEAAVEKAEAETEVVTRVEAG